MKFNVIDNNGKQIECDVIFTFKDDSNNISYIVYTDGTKDESGDLEIYSSRYVLENDNYILQAIENDYEWNMIDNMIASRFNEVD
ncbi:MAG: DUF1292 domain-containing protein [Bacilli bacterium]|nr:DUF1292 domain-containing protein [Bacilli bacterium]